MNYILCSNEIYIIMVRMNCILCSNEIYIIIVIMNCTYVLIKYTL